VSESECLSESRVVLRGVFAKEKKTAGREKSR